MKENDVMTITAVGQSTFPAAWRKEAGLEKGGLVEVRFLKDGKKSLLLTPKKDPRRGVVGLRKAMQSCPCEIPDVERHLLPSR
jgi:bifunctional DNA-binding transcriptional regulator/antitoxin component of YhaV-PrlF toxin-antitoxin module